MLPEQKGLVIPISLVSRSPSVVPNTLCKLLVSTANAAKPPADKLLSSQTNQPVSINNMPADLPTEESNTGSGNN